MDKDQTDEAIVIGVTSDTHGRLPQGLLDALSGVDLIIHAGDLDTPEILDELKKIAEVKVVAGNVDWHTGLRHLPKSLMFDVNDVYIYVLHDLLQLDIDLPTAGVQVLIHGHLHVPEIRQRQGVLYINPGSPVSPRQGSKPGFVRLTIQNQTPTAEWVGIE